MNNKEINEIGNVINSTENKENSEEKKTTIEEAIPREIRNNEEETPKNEENINEINKKKMFTNEEDIEKNAPIVKLVMEKVILNLNVFWLELLGFLNLIISIIIYETLGIIILGMILLLFEGEFNISDIRETFNVIINNIGLKWLIFIVINQHLSIGFLCLTTFSYMFREIKNIKMFYILNIIKSVLYYIFSIILLRIIIRDYFGGLIIDKIEEINIIGKDKAFEIINPIIEKIIVFLSNFLSSYNIFLERLALGSMYLFLFYEPRIISKTKILFFRLLSLIPILFMIVSLVLRALENRNVIKINEYISSFLLGPKISVYGYFITTLVEIKYKSSVYNVFDSDNYLDSRVFTKIGSKNFAFFGIIELLVGFFFPKWMNVGIGNNYLLILCAPIVAIYDYKKSGKTPFPCCNKGNFSLFFKIIIYLIGFLIVLILGIILLVLFAGFIKLYISPIIEFIIDNFDYIRELIILFI